MLSLRPWWTQQQRDDGAARARFLVIAALLVATVVSLATTSAPVRLLDARIFDYLSTLILPQVPEDAPIIVAIDEPSLAEVNMQWPWPRDLHAQLVRSLRAAGAKAIGLDIIFAEPSNPAADEVLAHALGPDVVLAADETSIETQHAAQHIRVDPLPEFTERGARPGVASIVIDGDSVVRRVPAYADGFARALLAAAGKEAREHRSDSLIQVFGPARTFDTISYYQALNPDEFLPEGTLEGRTAIVGLSMQSAPSVVQGGADAYATSFTVLNQRLVPGAEIQATIYSNIQHGMTIRPSGRYATIAGVLVAVAAAAFTVWRGSGWRTLLAGVAGVLLALAGSFGLLQGLDIYASPLAPSLAYLLVISAQGARDYAAERRMRRGITRAFSQYLSPVMVERLANDPSLLKLGGEKKTLTILFSDIRGFTTIAERMKDRPEDLTTLINRLLTPLSEVVLDAGGTIDKYMGDCIMAFWNAPLDDSDHAIHAVGAGMAMLDALARLNAELKAEANGTEPLQLSIGVGINTGECVVGNMGSQQRFDYSVLGDAVNLASRLEGETRAQGVPILLGPETARHLAGRFPLEPVAEVTVKGKSEAVQVWTISAGASHASKAR